ncbi:MAG: DUF4159 domain-containing protein [Rhodospirillales bacterium]|nr:DUF4159 domain-containing protein [Rhodospirillales bacterium]
MLSLGALTFAYPAALFGFAVLAVIWWFLRLTPPAPLRVAFPPVRLLANLIQQEESPARTPLWLLLLRLALASAIILSVAHPLLDAHAPLQNQGPVYILLDDDWVAATDWDKRRSSLLRLADQAERENRSVVFATTAPRPSSVRAEPLSLLSAADARKLFGAIQPKPWPSNRQAALDQLSALSARTAATAGTVFWLTNGVAEQEQDEDPSAVTAKTISALQKLGPVTVLTDGSLRLPVTLGEPVYENGSLTLTLRRSVDQGSVGYFLRAFGEDGQVLVRRSVVFEAGDLETEAALRLPSEQFNRLTRVDIEAAGHVGAVLLFDERWRRRPVGLATAGAGVPVQPLLREHHYLARALEPFTEVREGSVEDLLKREMAILALTDSGVISTRDRNDLQGWIAKGGVLLRFAGPNLAQSGNQENGGLLPVRLRAGDREIGGAMSWGKPATLAPFGEESPFYGLPIAKDVTVRRQVLASPSLDLAEKTWARLSDGTPLVTAERQGNGWSILFHTTANAEWSNLALSGMFVDMLRRIVGLSQGVSGSGDGPPLVAIETLDGFGVASDGNVDAQSIAQKDFEKTRVSADHPPGVYGDSGSRRVLNLSVGADQLTPLSALPVGVDQISYEAQTERDLRPWLLLAALVLFIIDSIASLALRGLLPMRRAIAGLVWVLVLAGSAGHTAKANEDFARANSLQTRLAYVISGDEQVDETSKRGLTGLSGILHDRTAAELGSPQAVDPGVDDLSFFPLLYWPIVPGYRLPNDLTAQRVIQYLQGGGTILFDTRDRSGGASALALRELAFGLDLPPLVPVPRDHVLTRSFYLLDDFPGRWMGDGVWIEKAGERVNDGVASVISGSHDWAAAWAVDDAQRPLYPVVPGGERQRELAYRFGVNLVMYTLTGNYKSDQVHLPAILERIGQ